MSRPQLALAAEDHLNAVEHLARTQPEVWTPRVVRLVQLELLRQHRIDCVRKQAYFEGQIAVCDHRMTKLQEEEEKDGQ